MEPEEKRVSYSPLVSAWAICLALAFVIALVASIALYRQRRARGHRSVWRAAWLAAASTVAMLAIAWWFGLRENVYVLTTQDLAMMRWRHDAEARSFGLLPSSELVRRGSTDIPLAAKEAAPPILADGWLNGPEPTSDELAGQVVVVDVFDDL